MVTAALGPSVVDCPTHYRWYEVRRRPQFCRRGDEWETAHPVALGGAIQGALKRAMM
jgi:hypothetical protein